MCEETKNPIDLERGCTVQLAVDPIGHMHEKSRRVRACVRVKRA